jgi:hypothetical protein
MLAVFMTLFFPAFWPRGINIHLASSYHTCKKQQFKYFTTTLTSGEKATFLSDNSILLSAVLN